MKTLRFTDQLKYFLKLALRLQYVSNAKAILLLLDGTADWKRLKNLVDNIYKSLSDELLASEQNTSAGVKTDKKPDDSSNVLLEEIRLEDKSSESKVTDSGKTTQKQDAKALDKLPPPPQLIVAANTAEELEGAEAEGIGCIELEMTDFPMVERLTQALLEAVSAELIQTKSTVVTLYGGFEPDEIDSVSLMRLNEHFERLTIHDLRKLETTVPLDILKIVVDMAIDIGRDGREGKPVGTMFVVGDQKKILAECNTAGFDMVKGYSAQERDLSDPRVREGIKEVAQLDGAFVISPKGIVEASCQTIQATAKSITLSKGLGTRHWAAAAISRSCNAIAVTVSQTNGTVRIFQNGEIVLRIEQTKRRPVIWREFDYEPPQ